LSFFGESAKEALSWARQAFERVIKIEQQMVSVADAVQKYESRTQLAQQAFELRVEQRVEQRMSALEASVKGELRDFEGRLRVLEAQVASVGAKVDGGFAQAAGLIYADAAAATRRDSGIGAVIQRNDAGPRLGDGTSES